MNTKKFSQGDAVQAQDGTEVYVGVVIAVYDDVVEIEYRDMETRTRETMEFHEDDVQHYPVIKS